MRRCAEKLKFQAIAKSEELSTPILYKCELSVPQDPADTFIDMQVCVVKYACLTRL